MVINDLQKHEIKRVLALEGWYTGMLQSVSLNNGTHGHVMILCQPFTIQQSGTVQCAISVPFTTSENGNANICVPYCTLPNHTAL